VSIDMYGSDTCLAVPPAAPCGYKLSTKFGSEMCIARECEAELVMAWYNERVFPLLAPHQRVWVIPGLFGNSNKSSAAGNHSHQETQLLQSLNAYTTWMKHEPRIAAMVPWHWFSRSSPRSPEFALGAKEFPALVAGLEAFGRDLKRNTSATITTVPTKWLAAPGSGLKTDDDSTTTLYVSPTGADTGDGSLARPFLMPSSSSQCVKNGVATASCFGFDAQDSTTFLQAALSSNASLVIVDRQPSPWIVGQPLVVTEDNIHVHFDDDVLVLAKEGGFKGKGDGLLTINRRRNVTLSGGSNATLQMRRADYADQSKYNHSEFRMGLWMIDSVDVTVRSLTIADTGGGAS